MTNCKMAIPCSQQSIFSAMDRFVKSVNNMTCTVLVPSRLRDMQVTGCKNQRRIPPALTSNPDLYSFFLMLQEVKKELLWGPGTGAATAATMSTLVMNGNCIPTLTCPIPCRPGHSRNQSLTLTNTYSHHTSAIAGAVSNGAPSTPNPLHSLTFMSTMMGSTPTINGGHNNSTTTTTTTTTTSSTSSTIIKSHTRQPSDDSLGSLASTMSSNTTGSNGSNGLDNDSDIDSFLNETMVTTDEETSHLASAFRHHLQGLHTILNQLSDSAEYLTIRYQEEVDASSL